MSGAATNTIFAMSNYLLEDEGRKVVELVRDVLGIGGVISAVVLFGVKLRRDRRIHERETFDALNDKFILFMREVMNNPPVGVGFYESDKLRKNLSEKQRNIQDCLYAMLISLFEQAYLLYKNTPKKGRDAQWPGWDEYIEQYCRRSSFVELWGGGKEAIEGHSQFDREFERYLDQKIANVELASKQQTSPAPADGSSVN